VFLRPALKRPGATLRTHAQALAVSFDGKRATGVRYRDGDGAVREIVARREVILSSGTVNSAKLLQLSGIGPAKLLNDLEIPIVHTLEGVGENLRDHFSARIVARARNVLTINEYGRWPRLGLEMVKWLSGRPSVLAISPSLAYVHARSHPDVEDADIRILFTPGSYKEGRIYVLDDYPGMSCGAAQPRPESSGYVRIRSRDPAEPPRIQPNYLDAEADQRITLAGMRLVRRMLNGPEMARYFDRETLPGPEARTDDELLDFARRRGNTGYHLVGTCRMAPATNSLAVVDDRLRVHGVENLRVADASIMPKAADLIGNP
jgi:choline dehydrogenase